MAFSIQINHDLSFNHDEYLLKKAEQYTPTMITKEVPFVGLVDLIKDDTKLEGVGIQKNSKVLHEQQYQKNDTLILDFGTHQVGQFSMDIKSVGSPMDAPLYIRLRFAEVAAELSHESQEYDGWLSRSWIQEEYIHLDELPTTLTLPRRYSFRFVEIKVIDTSPKWSVVFSHPTVKTASCGDETKLPKIEIKDPELEKIYQVGIKTLHDCMSDVFEDGPKRDRRLWLGDLRLQALSNYVSFDQKELVKRCLYLFAGMTTSDGRISANVFTKPHPIPNDTFLLDYSLFFISTLYNYLQHHQDTELLNDLYPIAKTQIDYTTRYIDENGKTIWDENYPCFVDWSNEFNKETSEQAIFIYCFKQFIALTKMRNEKKLLT